MAHNSQLIKEEALRIGFVACGISRIEPLTKDAQRLNRWIEVGMHGQMDYMARNIEKRINPALLIPNAKTIISLAVNYLPEKIQNPDLPQIAKYAYGKDYHLVVKDMMHQLLHTIRSHYGEVSGRVFTDSAPILESAWAARSGIGWVGKHSLIIHPHYGSYIVLGELIIDLNIEPDAPVIDRCGSCTRCMDTCPVSAITAPHTVDARKCLAYLTIEHRGTFEKNISLHHRLFGCDICQDVCPWNAKAKTTLITEFKPNCEIIDKTADEWLHMDDITFTRITNHSPMNRTGLDDIKRNVITIMESK